MFEMGYQGDAARSPGQHRGGLGLAVARGLVQAHGGEITVRNAGAGCQFTVSLPLGPNPDAWTPEPADGVDQIPARKSRMARSKAAG